MTFQFADGLGEAKFHDLNEALAYLDNHAVEDRIVNNSDISLGSLSEVKLPGRKSYRMTRAAFVQIEHFVNLAWEDTKDQDPTELLQEIQSRLKERPGQLMFRIKQKVVQAVLSPSYTPITNADILRSTSESLDLSNAQVTTFRGYLRITGVSDSVKFQPEVGDIISGGWEIVNNEFGKGVLSVNQFLLRLVCTNGAVVHTGNTRKRFVHRGWERDGLIRHISEAGSETISQMYGLNDALRQMTQTRIGEKRFHDITRSLASSLGRKGLDDFRSKISPDSSLYDAYNHLTFVSQQKSFGPRRELEMIAGNLL